MSRHPYNYFKDQAFWRRSVAKPSMLEVDPVYNFQLKISPTTKVATAGSCFAQHIARHLKKSGFNYYVAEQGHPIIKPHIRQRHNYGTFSARYGNIYTARQLIQLFHRAYGIFQPHEPPWIDNNHKVRDPFRPNIQPNGFISTEEMLADRQQHLTYVKAMFEKLDVFIFTLGLTECWRCKTDGAVFPICPGVEGGEFAYDKYEFYNQSYEDVITDMTLFFKELENVNPKAQIILTVSPVPLMATAEPGQHVLAATTYSKSVLRVAVETLKKKFAKVHYFPSYEIITGAYNRGSYYADDLRNVLESGVSHVMKLFLKHATDTDNSLIAISKEAINTQVDTISIAQKFVDVECDEEALDNNTYE